MTFTSMGEFDYIRWVRGQASAADGVRVGIGDDCAVLTASGRETLITTDMLLDGVHFHLSEHGPERVGRKALAVNLSDIAAMGGQATAAVVSLALPRRETLAIAEGIFRGMKRLADDFGVAIVGGDTNSWDGPFAISITLLGEPNSHGAILRSGTQAGDWLLVTGSFGGSILGKHLDFTPRVREAQLLQEHCRPHAMIDVSDGLAADVGHLAEESGRGFVLFAERIPISDAARAMNDGKSPLEHALGDGEDFELAITVTPGEGQRLIDGQPLPGMLLSWVGICLEERGLYLESDGRRSPLASFGFKHAFGD